MEREQRLLRRLRDLGSPRPAIARTNADGYFMTTQQIEDEDRVLDRVARERPCSRPPVNKPLPPDYYDWSGPPLTMSGIPNVIPPVPMDSAEDWPINTVPRDAYSRGLSLRDQLEQTAEQQIREEQARRAEAFIPSRDTKLRGTSPARRSEVSWASSATENDILYTPHVYRPLYSPDYTYRGRYLPDSSSSSGRHASSRRSTSWPSDISPHRYHSRDPRPPRQEHEGRGRPRHRSCDVPEDEDPEIVRPGRRRRYLRATSSPIYYADDELSDGNHDSAEAAAAARIYEHEMF